MPLKTPSHSESNSFAPQTARYMTTSQPVRHRAERHYAAENAQPNQNTHTRNPLLLLSGLAGAAWFVFAVVQMIAAMRINHSGSEYDIAIREFRAGMSMALQLPSIICAFVGVVLTWIAWLTRKYCFALAAGILFGIAVLIGFGKPFGYIPFMLLNITAYVYAKLKERI